MALMAMRRQEVRRTLAPLLEGVRLRLGRGDLAAAESLCEKLLAADPDWPEARGPARPDNRGTRRPRAPLRRPDGRAPALRIGADLGRAPGAARPGQPRWQRDLSVSYQRLGDVSRQGGRLDAARGFYQQSLVIAKKLAAADPADAQAQRDLSLSLVKLGDVSQQAGQMDAAREFYQQYLDIAKKLAAADPANAEAQRDLSVSYQRMGDVSQQAGRLDAAREFYQQYLDIAKKLAAADPTNAQAQRDLWVSCIKLAASRRDIDGVAQAAEGASQPRAQDSGQSLQRRLRLRTVRQAGGRLARPRAVSSPQRRRQSERARCEERREERAEIHPRRDRPAPVRHESRLQKPSPGCRETPTWPRSASCRSSRNS